MKLITLIIVVFSAALSASEQVFAATYLSVAESFNIRAINGKSYSTGLITQERKLQLRPGKNLLVIEYEEVFDSDDGDSFDIVKSEPFLLSIYVTQGHSYAQKIVKPANAEAAYRYIKNPLFEIADVSPSVDQNKRKIEHTLKPLASNNSNYLVAQTKMSSNNRLILSSPNDNHTKTDALLMTQQKGSQSRTSQMLDYWWAQATPDEKKRFLKSIKNK